MTLSDIAAIVWIVAGVLVAITEVSINRKAHDALNQLMEEDKRND